jgi:hypothetical protein
MKRPKRQYRRVDTTTLKGLKEAERLHANGWKQIQVGMFSILFERTV